MYKVNYYEVYANIDILATQALFVMEFTPHSQDNINYDPFGIIFKSHSNTEKSAPNLIKGGRMGRSDKVSLWCVSSLINNRFRFFILE